MPLSIANISMWAFAAALLIALGIYYLIPEYVIGFIDFFPIKFFLFLFVIGLLANLFALIFIFYYVPTVERMLAISWRFSLLLGGSCTGADIFSLPMIEAQADTGRIIFKTYPSSGPTYIPLGITLTAVFLMAGLYILHNFISRVR